MQGLLFLALEDLFVLDVGDSDVLLLALLLGVRGFWGTATERLAAPCTLAARYGADTGSDTEADTDADDDEEEEEVDEDVVLLSATKLALEVLERVALMPLLACVTTSAFFSSRD